jgi:hypothetical protein
MSSRGTRLAAPGVSAGIKREESGQGGLEMDRAREPARTAAVAAMHAVPAACCFCSRRTDGWLI